MNDLEKGFFMNTSDPITRLTKAEKRLIKHLNNKSSRAEVLAELKTNLQTAIEIELVTIPIYLFTYYSIKRKEKSGENIRPCDLFANKAGGVIMSVAVEEMLHMSLSSNVLYSLGVEPLLYRNSPGPYPTALPYHNPTGPSGPHGGTAVKIPLSKLSYEQLWHFLQIEYPEQKGAMPQDKNWDTIGQFYSYIRCLICTKWITDGDFQVGRRENQIQPYNYSPNNVDTVHPKGKFDPWKPAPTAPTGPRSRAASDTYPSASEAARYSNVADSHTGPTQLLSVGSRFEALEAIDTICDQGEGYPRLGKGPEKIDDPSKSELSHYYKFLTLQAQLEPYILPKHKKRHKETLPKVPKPPDPVSPTVTAAELKEVIIEFPVNPVTADYEPDLRPISDFCNGVFQYMLILTETIYKVPPAEQKLFFNEGMHRSMIWVLDKFVQNMAKIEIEPSDYESGVYEGFYMAPTFENIDLGPRKTSFAKLFELGEAAVAASSSPLTKSALDASGLV